MRDNLEARKCPLRLGARKFSCAKNIYNYSNTNYLYFEID